MAKHNKTSVLPRRRGVAAKKPLLLHHRHSFKLAHHRHTSYPLVFFILLLTVLFCVGWTSFTKGDDFYVVHAVVPAAPLPSAATIDSPADNTDVSNQIITVSGSCPENSYIRLLRNQAFAGMDTCQAGGWQIQLSLVAGDNHLTAQAYNVTDQPGPASNGITVRYVPPAKQSEVTPAATSSAPPATTPLGLGADIKYRGYYVDQPTEWPLTVDGGRAPYAVQIDWGDGETDLKSLAAAGPFTLQHSYKQPNADGGPYTVKVLATDADGQVSLLQLFVIISEPGGGSGNGNSDLRITGSANGQGSDRTGVSPYSKFWSVAAPTYAVTFIAAASFWLGEMHQLSVVGHHASRFIKPKRWRF